MSNDLRNLNPHAEAVAAMWLFGARYSQQRGGSMDFWDALSDSDKRLCSRMVSEILQATDRSETAPAKTATHRSETA